MLTAKLFAALASILAIFAFLVRGGILPSMGLYFHTTKFVVAPFHWQLIGALVCATLALIHFAVAQWMPPPLNQSMGLVSFTFIAFAFAVWLTASFSIGRGSLPSNWQIGTLFGAIFGFLFGCALFAVNVAWTLFRRFRVRFCFH
jgi:heme/copper-type cytochrome/quinol oxidase subunit 1